MIPKGAEQTAVCSTPPHRCCKENPTVFGDYCCITVLLSIFVGTLQNTPVRKILRQPDTTVLRCTCAPHTCMRKLASDACPRAPCETEKKRFVVLVHRFQRKNLHDAVAQRFSGVFQHAAVALCPNPPTHPPTHLRNRRTIHARTKPHMDPTTSTTG